MIGRELCCKLVDEMVINFTIHFIIFYLLKNIYNYLNLILSIFVVLFPISLHPVLVPNNNNNNNTDRTL